MNREWTYRAVCRRELEYIWEKNIDAHSEDERWITWRDGAISGHENGMMQTFAVFHYGEPVGEGTLMFSPECPQIGGRKQLADGMHIANINGLRIESLYEGQGHVSRMVHEMERNAYSRGVRRITIGVEAKETRNLSIYIHWGYTEFVHHQLEDGELVLYYAKTL